MAVFNGDSADNVLTGLASDDILNGFGGNDTLDGGNGNDVLTGGTGNDTLSGGQGTDTYMFSSGFGSDALIQSARPSFPKPSQAVMTVFPAGPPMTLSSAAMAMIRSLAAAVTIPCPGMPAPISWRAEAAMTAIYSTRAAAQM